MIARLQGGLCAFVALLLAVTAASAETTIRVGYFPNVTHTPGIIGCETTRRGHGWFEQRLGDGVVVKWYVFNAGPSAMEAIFAGGIDLTYVGPSPVLNAYIRSGGDEIRVLSGCAEGGAALVVAAKGPLRTPADFRGRRIATPQLGGTQDVAARSWLVKQGYRLTLAGGDVTVLPVANSDQLLLFLRGSVDGVWTVEPWVSRLERQGGGRIYLEQKDAISTVLVSSVRFLREHPGLASRFEQAHRELIAWVNANPAQARKLVTDGLGAATGTKFPPSLVEAAWPRLRFTDRIAQAQFDQLVADAQSVGFLRNAIPLDRLFSRVP
jgi:NitT/TauT family transport system substrate-binding protein